MATLIDMLSDPVAEGNLVEQGVTDAGALLFPFDPLLAASVITAAPDAGQVETNFVQPAAVDTVSGISTGVDAVGGVIGDIGSGVGGFFSAVNTDIKLAIVVAALVFGYLVFRK